MFPELGQVVPEFRDATKLENFFMGITAPFIALQWDESIYLRYFDSARLLDEAQFLKAE